MKTTMLKSLLCLCVLILAGFSSAEAQIPETTFKAGAYRGIMQVTTSIDGVAETTTSLKVKGRSEGNSTLRFMGAPDLAKSVFEGDSSTTLFLLEYSGLAASMILTEMFESGGASTGKGPSSLSVKGNSVHADLNYTRMLGSNTVNYTIRIRLIRVGK